MLTSQSGSAAFVTDGFGADKTGVLTIAAQRGLQVVVNVHYPPTHHATGAKIAAQVRAANPDLVINNGLGVDTVNPLQRDEAARLHAAADVQPVPGAGSAARSRRDQARASLSDVALRAEPGGLARLGGDVPAIVDDFKTRATAAKLPYPVFETQAAASWNAWQILTAGVKGAGSLDQQAICDSLHAKGARHHVQRAPRVRPEGSQLLAEHRASSRSRAANGSWSGRPTGRPRRSRPPRADRPRAGRPRARPPGGTGRPGIAGGG